MSLNANRLRRTIDTLQQAITEIRKIADENDILYDLFRNAAIKSFELSLENSGNLLRKALKLYGGSPRKIDGLVFKDLFRHASKHGILDEGTVLRWFAYRDNRNITTHDYGEGFANETLKILPEYIKDATALADRLEEIFRAAA